jgi:hypothetical protein
VRRALLAALFLVACKESKPADPAAKETPTPTERASQAQRQRPYLGGDVPENGRERPRLHDGSGSDGETREGRRERMENATPEERDAMRDRMEERRKRREEMLDTNKDGVVSDEERQARMEPMRKRLDADGDGKLTPEELGASERRMGFDDPGAVDVNKDGEISLAELDAAMSSRREKMRERWRGRGGRGSADGVGPD